MKKMFWIFLILGFLCVNEYLAEFFLAIFVGNMEAIRAFNQVASGFQLDAYFFSAMFRLVPFVALAILAAKSKSIQQRSGQICMWVLLGFILSWLFYGYWAMQHSLFTQANAPSTFGLTVIYFPLWGLVFGACIYLAYWVALKAHLFNEKPA